MSRVEFAGGEIRKMSYINRRGCPDRLVMLPGRVIWVEVKAPGKKAEPHQEREHERLRAAGQDVRVIDSLEGIERLLSE